MPVSGERNRMFAEHYAIPEGMGTVAVQWWCYVRFLPFRRLPVLGACAAVASLLPGWLISSALASSTQSGELLV